MSPHPSPTGVTTGTGTRPDGGRHRQDDRPAGGGTTGASRGRNIPVDTLRGVACLFLVTFHVIGFSASDGIQVADDSAFRYYTDSVDYLRMPLFTLVSGLVYAWRPLGDVHGYGKFMAKKARRLLVPYIVFVPAIGVTQAVLDSTNSSRELEPLSWLLYSLSPYWFLLTSFWIFAVVALLDSFDLLSSRVNFAALFLASVAVVLFTTTEDFRVLQLGQALTLAPFFLAGVAMYRFSLFPRRTSVKIVLTAVLLVVVVAVQISLNDLGGVFDGFGPFDSRHSVLGITLGILFPLVFLSWSLSSRWLAWIGGYSSGIFLLHSFAIGGSRAILGILGLDSRPVEFVVLSIAGVGLSIIGVILLRKVAVGRLVLGENMKVKAS
ncbi:MAG TPA: acyltransferase [Candidatus Corynebacterium avicola]|uniref:Acyltransferase n=1 Tax=Candidatus Corynebacterium avicola TaxID=2838527 RepID=A0A9D1RMY7_9CORY|nr:acyltransferase [Candidatus Corynebacterium avicola]